MTMPPFFYLLPNGGHGAAARDAATRFERSALARFPEMRTIARSTAGVLLAGLQAAVTIDCRWGRVHIVGAPHPRGGIDRLRREETLRDPPAILGWLTRSIWGRYVAIVECDGDVLAFRDPSGASSLQVIEGEHVVVAGSGFDRSLIKAAGCDAVPNIAALAQVLARPPSAAHLPLLAHVTPIGPGRARSLATGKESVVWSPATIAARARDPKPEDLVATLDETISALAPPSKVAVELSGGFDSSCVFASLAAAGRSCAPFNVATSAGGGDERRFARSMAMRWGVPLSEHQALDDLPDYRPLEAASTGVAPLLQGLDSVFAGAREAAIAESSAGAVMTGQGGDSVFFQLPTRLVAADRLSALGLRALSSLLLVDDAVRVGGSIWSVVATAFGHRVPDDRRALPALVPHLMGAHGRDCLDLSVSVHPWLEDAEALPPAKRRHLMTLVHAQLFHGERLFAPSVPLIHPLLTQPILELLLPCPAHVLAQGPLDRGFARAAMRGRLSREVAERRSKGETSDHYARAVLHNLAWLREMLLDGALVSAGLLDREAIDGALDGQAIRLTSDYRGFVVFAALECWLRQWR